MLCVLWNSSYNQLFDQLQGCLMKQVKDYFIPAILQPFSVRLSNIITHYIILWTHTHTHACTHTHTHACTPWHEHAVSHPSPWRHQCRVSPGHIAGTFISSHTNTSCIHLVIQCPVIINTTIWHQLYNTLESQTKFWKTKRLTNENLNWQSINKLEACPHRKKDKNCQKYTAKSLSHKIKC